MERRLAVQVRCTAAPAGNPPQRPAVKLGGRYFTTGSGNGNGNNGFVFPEQQLAQSEFSVPGLLNKPNVGVGVAGGGFRATNLAAGWVQGLSEDKDVWDNIRYLASNSGGSWFNCAFSYRNLATPDSHTNFLEPYVKPGELTLKRINQAPSSKYLDIVATNSAVELFINTAYGMLTAPEESNVSAWSHAIGNTFLAPFGIGEVNSTVSDHTTKAYSRVAEQLKGLDPQPELYVAAPGGPYPLVVGSAYLLEDPVDQFYPVEFAPLSAGTPSFHSFKYNTTTVSLGGGLVEPLLVDSRVPGAPLPDSPDGSVTLDSTGGTLFPLTLIAGISSAFFGASIFKLLELVEGMVASTGKTVDPTAPQVAKINYPALLNEQAKRRSAEGAQAQGLLLERVLSIISEQLLGFALPGPSPPALPVADEFQYVDGGGNDNTAIYPLLRRGVEHVVLLVACDSPIALQDDGTPDYVKTANLNHDVARSFGALPVPGVTDGVDNVVLNKNSQVFPTSGWKDLVGALHANMLAGKPAAVRRSYTTLENPFQFVKGGWEVDVLWVWNQKCGEWESQLPQETQNELKDARDKVKAASDIPSPSPIFPTGDLAAWIGPFIQNLLTVKELWGSIGSLSFPMIKHPHAFPYISTFTTRISAKPANMMYQQAAWTTKIGVANDIKDMIAKAKAKQ